MEAAGGSAGPSYVSGTSDTPLLYLTVGQALDAAVARAPDQPALIVRHQGVRWSYRELAARVDELARGLLALGLEPGDRVGIWSPNNAEWVLTQFATARAGLVLVNINPAYRISELGYALGKVGCRALILAPSFKTSDYVAIVRELVPEVAAGDGRVSSARFPRLGFLVQLGEAPVPGFMRFGELAALSNTAETPA